MKKRFIFGLFIMLISWVYVYPVVGPETLIDFTKYVERVIAELKKDPNVVVQTNADGSFKTLYKNEKGEVVSVVTNKDGTRRFMLRVEDLVLSKWEIDLNSSAQNVENLIYSMCTNVYSKKWQGDVLGCRIHFPIGRQNCWARIHPPYEIQAFDDNAKPANINNGVIDNVGQIKTISVWVNGRNYKNGFAIRLKDRDDIVTEYFMGYLYFQGWRMLSWKNPNYITEIADRTLRRLPLYPRSRPYVKLDSFVVYRQMDDVGGDFVVYIKDVMVEYDRAILDEEQDIQDEEIWHILAERNRKKKIREEKRVVEIQILKEQEKARTKALAEGNKGNTKEKTNPAGGTQ